MGPVGRTETMGPVLPPSLHLGNLVHMGEFSLLDFSFLLCKRGCFRELTGWPRGPLLPGGHTWHRAWQAALHERLSC